MVANRLKIILEQREYSGLIRLAAEHLRTPEEQLRWLLRKELEKVDLLESQHSDIEEQTNDVAQS